MWNEKLKKARAKMWEYQTRFDCYPDINVGLNKDCWFNLSSPFIYFDVPEKLEEPFLHCYLEDYDLQRIVHRDLHWNNASVGMRIMFDRRPNIYNPDVSVLLCFFHQ